VQDWKKHHGKNHNMKKNGDMTEFEDSIKKINEIEELLTQESNTIEDSLKQAEIPPNDAPICCYSRKVSTKNYPDPK
jgi:hypothetical protein